MLIILVSFSAVGILPGSPNRHIAESGSTLSSFPLPYRSQSAIHYSSSPTEYSSTTSPLTSQEYRLQHSSPNQALPGRYSSPNDSLALAGSNNLSESDLGSLYTSSPNWQSRDLKWPQSRSKSRRKYVPKGRRYDSPIIQRRVMPGNDPFRPSKRPSSGFTAGAFDNNSQNGIKGRIPGPTSTQGSSSSGDHPRLVSYPLPSYFSDGQESTIVASRHNPTSMSQYISTEDTDDSMRSIRESKYWLQFKDDPIFSDLSKDSGSITIKDLVKRRDLSLRDHVSRPAIMKEQGTQTDPESSPLLHPIAPFLDATSNRTRELSAGFIQPQREQKPTQKLTSLRPSSQPVPRNNPYMKENNGHYRTASLTDTETPPIYTPQPNKMRGLKRSRSATEEDYNSDYLNRKKTDVSSGSQDQATFYRYQSSHCLIRG